MFGELIIFSLWFLCSLIGYYLAGRFKRASSENKHACVIVLGDIGRSPRMNYHCLSLAKKGYKVTLIGYQESKQMSEIDEEKNINIIPLMIYPKFLQIGPRIFQYIIKVIFLSFTLVFSLYQMTTIPNFLLVQNPPSIPTLIISFLYVKITQSKLIIDWHNYGFTILALANHAKHPLVKFCKLIEIFFGRFSDYNICVTNAMRQDLNTYGIKALTLYDKPHERFQPLKIEDKHSFFLKLAQNYKLNEIQSDNSDNTVFTESINGQIQMRQNRPALIVSCSSWTEDEDFQILFKALQNYQKDINGLPNLICILTGKGPLRQHYENLFQSENFQNIKIKFLWLEAQDYPLLLGSADLGISLHKSSSDLDLPMKVVDMFGTTLPVCALRFKCIEELVKINSYGKLFNNSDELFNCLRDLVVNLNDNSSLIEYRSNLNEFQKKRWTDEWSDVMKQII